MYEKFQILMNDSNKSQLHWRVREWPMNFRIQLAVKCKCESSVPKDGNVRGLNCCFKRCTDGVCTLTEQREMCVWRTWRRGDVRTEVKGQNLKGVLTF